jgi:hypothetical protein
VPGWGEILEEFKESGDQRGGQPDFDGIRRKYIRRLAEASGRPVIVYATAYLNRAGPADLSITLQDMQGFMEACRELPGPTADLILHSPGGSAEATQSIVHYLRQKYEDIRVFVPLAAMSAATMLSMAGTRIVMGKHSQLGPIDPQLTISDRNGTRTVAASAILDQFKQAKSEIGNDQKTLGAWAQILPMYGPGLLQQCETATALAKGLVKDWLRQYMLHEDPEKDEKSERIAEFLGTHRVHQSHGVGIFREKLRELGLVIDDLEDNLQDEVLSVFHATTITFNGTLCVKLIENNLDRAYLNTLPPPIQPFPFISPPPVMPPPGQQPRPGRPPNQ